MDWYIQAFFLSGRYHESLQHTLIMILRPPSHRRLTKACQLTRYNQPFARSHRYHRPQEPVRFADRDATLNRPVRLAASASAFLRHPALPKAAIH